MKPYCDVQTGLKRWYVDGKLHREDGPAVERTDSSRYKAWFIKNKLHRLDGPAVEDAHGTKEYWIDDKLYSFEEWDRLRKMLWLL